MLALAHRIERLVDARELSGYAEAARTLGLTRARLTQVMNLLLLAPEIQHAILTGRTDMTERGLRRVVRIVDWKHQQAIVPRSTQV